LIVGVIAVILFGNRLPSVARSLGKSLNEFKRGMHDFESEMRSSIYTEPPKSVGYNEKIEHRTPTVDLPASDATSSSEAAALPSSEATANEPPSPSAT
jgi:sec-independent protein translocase protein TatA